MKSVMAKPSSSLATSLMAAFRRRPDVAVESQHLTKRDAAAVDGALDGGERSAGKERRFREGEPVHVAQADHGPRPDAVTEVPARGNAFRTILETAQRLGGKPPGVSATAASERTERSRVACRAGRNSRQRQEGQTRSTRSSECQPDRDQLRLG